MKGLTKKVLTADIFGRGGGWCVTAAVQPTWCSLSTMLAPCVLKGASDELHGTHMPEYPVQGEIHAAWRDPMQLDGDGMPNTTD